MKPSSPDGSTGIVGCAITPHRVFYDDGTHTLIDATLAWAPRAILAGTLGRFAQHCTIVVDGPTAADHAQHSAGIRADGWVHTTVGAWTLYRRGGRTVALGLRASMDLPHLGVLFDFDTPPDVVATRLLTYARATGCTWRGTPATSALAGIRLSWDDRRRGEPLWRLPSLPPVRHAGPLVWRRPLTPAERDMGFVHEFDAISAYLGAAGNAELGWSGVEHTKRRPFDPRVPGWWFLDLDEAVRATLDDPLRPPFISPRKGLGGVWVTTPMAQFIADDLGNRGDVIDSYTGTSTPGSATQRPRPASTRVLLDWQRRMRDGRAWAADTTVEHAWKRTYKDAVGAMQRQTMRIWRPDWGHTIVDLWRATVLRRILRVHREMGIWPCAVKTDSLAYAHWERSPSDFAAQLSLLDASDPPTLGGYRHDAVYTTHEWEASHA